MMMLSLSITRKILSSDAVDLRSLANAVSCTCWLHEKRYTQQVGVLVYFLCTMCSIDARTRDTAKRYVFRLNDRL